MSEGFATFPKCFDAYLRYTILTDFENFDRDGLVFLLVELEHPEAAGEFEEEIGTFGAEFGPDIGDTRYITVRVRARLLSATRGRSGQNAFVEWSCRSL